FIAISDPLDSQIEKAALHLDSNYTIFVPHWSTRARTETQQQRSRSSRPVALPAMMGKTNLDAMFVRRVAQLNSSKSADIKKNHFSVHDAALTVVSQLPPHVRTVYRRSDPNKTELIAKHLREGSNELDILKFLHTIRPQSPHIISLIETIPSTTGGWLILPKLHPIRDQGFMDSGGVRGRDQLGQGLIEGLGYLHEHRIAQRRQARQPCL
ncbi:hypothetical protein EDB89DRAFT_2006019, partial [Lactarius sanguifluus]